MAYDLRNFSSWALGIISVGLWWVNPRWEEIVSIAKIERQTQREEGVGRLGFYTTF